MYLIYKDGFTQQAVGECDRLLIIQTSIIHLHQRPLFVCSLFRSVLSRTHACRKLCIRRDAGKKYKRSLKKTNIKIFFRKPYFLELFYCKYKLCALNLLIFGS